MPSKIEWTEMTWNVTSGCTRASEGCRNCYAERLVSTRLRHLPQNEGVTKDGRWTGVIRCHEDKLLEPLKRKTPTRYFVCSQSDLFHDGVPFEFVDKVFAVMALCPQHTFILLTKRPERMAEYVAQLLSAKRHVISAGLSLGLGLTLGQVEARMSTAFDGDTGRWIWNKKGNPLKNAWLGVSIEDQATADKRIPELLKVPAAVRWVSYEPAIGPVNLDEWIGDCLDCDAFIRLHHEHGDLNHYADGDKELPFHWVVMGGESGPNARPMNPNWARSMRDQCNAAGVPLFFKQWGEFSCREIDPNKTHVHVNLFPVDGLLAYSNNESERFILTESSGVWEPIKDIPANAIGCSRVGKKAAGCLLDGREHKEFPEVTP